MGEVIYCLRLGKLILNASAVLKLKQFSFSLNKLMFRTGVECGTLEHVGREIKFLKNYHSEGRVGWALDHSFDMNQLTQRTEFQPIKYNF